MLHFSLTAVWKTPNKGEERILVNSPKVATYDLKPEMSAYEVCGKLVDAIKSDKYDVIIINFANPDMVGHTGVEGAAIKAVEAVDECVGKAVEAVKRVDGVMFICAGITVMRSSWWITKPVRLLPHIRRIRCLLSL